jgi:hypothetical protein
MDGCLLEDAFKTNSLGSGTEKAQKHERKKMKRTKDCFKGVLDPTFNPEATDPDRPAVFAKEYKEAFQNISASLPNIPTTLSNKPLPSYFLGNDDDDDDSKIEGFQSNFSNAATAVANDKGFEKAEGTSLPIPSINEFWKPITPAQSNTAFFQSVPSPSGEYPTWTNTQKPRKIEKTISSSSELLADTRKTSLQKQIDDLVAKLAELEKNHATNTYTKTANQQEVIAFVGTGVFIIFVLNLLKH